MKKGLFESQAGRVSMTNTVVFIHTLATIGFGVLATLLNSEIGLQLSVYFLVASLGGKALIDFAKGYKIKAFNNGN